MSNLQTNTKYVATRFVFLILPQIHILDLAGPDQAIHEAIDYNADFSIAYCGISQKVNTTSGLPFGAIPHFSRARLYKGDFLIIPGSAYDYLTSKSFLQNKPLFQWIRQQHHKGVNICSICMGAFVLAETGLLNGKPCTTHFKKTKALQQRYPAIQVQENILFTHHENIFTSAGISAGIDLTLYIIEQLKGNHLAHLVARELVVYNRRKGSDSQESELLKFRNHIHSGIHHAQDFIAAHIHRKHTLVQLASVANMSERNFTRIFKKETGVTVNRFINTIRKARALDLLKNPDLSKTAVANQLGLQSEKQLTRIIKSV